MDVNEELFNCRLVLHGGDLDVWVDNFVPSDTRKNKDSNDDKENQTEENVGDEEEGLSAVSTITTAAHAAFEPKA